MSDFYRVKSFNTKLQAMDQKQAEEDGQKIWVGGF
jgi:hypothetical protein